MHNTAEGFDSESTPEFVRFLRYAKRSCTEVQSELYVALDQQYITNSEFQGVYDHAARTRAAIGGFIKYLISYQQKTQTLYCPSHTFPADPAACPGIPVLYYEPLADPAGLPGSFNINYYRHDMGRDGTP